MADYSSKNIRSIDLSETIAKRWHWQLNVRLNDKLSQYYVECDRFSVSFSKATLAS